MFKRSKILTTLITIMLIVSLVACGASNDKLSNANAVTEVVNDYYANIPQDNNKIKQDAFIDKVKAGEDMFILDIRQPDVYNKGHIKGAVNAPWGTAISDNLDKLPTDKPIMVYCYSGQTAGQTVALLNMAGFEAKSVNLGWNLGISKVEGYEDIVETKVNDFDEATGVDIDPEIKNAIENYYKGLADVKGTMFKNYKISEDNLKKSIDEEDESIYILSIRKADDFSKGHIEGATNIPWGKGMEKEFNKLPKDKTIVVYCYTGQTAGQTVAGLRLLGYDAVSLNGGIGMKANEPYGWINKGYDVVK